MSAGSKQGDFWERLGEEESSDADTALGPSATGRAGQYLAAAEVELAGFPCSLAAEGLPYDLLADVDGRPARIQVKATKRSSSYRPSERMPVCYVFTMPKQPRVAGLMAATDVFAFVALDQRATLFIPSSKLRRIRNIKIRATAFEERQLRERSLVDALNEAFDE